jgi:hypothetical protein
MTDSQTRRRWITLGETIALLALVVSALGVWLSWKSSNADKATRVVEQRQTIPLTLRGVADRDGSDLTISPVESSHGLQSLTVVIKGSSPIEVGSDGRLSAGDVQSALKDQEKEPKDRTMSVPVRISARYVEMGKDRRGGGNYVLHYKWEGGGLFGGRSLRLVGLSR